MKEILSSVAVVLTFVAYIPYYRDILRGKTHPHIYSWSLWGLLTILIIALQIIGGAGSAVWVTAAAGLLCCGVVMLSLKNGKKDITTSDTVVAILSLIAIAFWLIAHQPIVSILLVIIADLLAFIPTVRKSWYKPYSETLSFMQRMLFDSFWRLLLLKPILFYLHHGFSSGQSEMLYLQ